MVRPTLMLLMALAAALLQLQVSVASRPTAGFLCHVPNHPTRNGRRPLALAKLMATRGGVAGGKVQEVRSLSETEEAMEAAGDKLVVLDFTATWCGPCKLIAPVFESLSEEVSEAVFLKVDVDENGETASRFEVQQMPVSEHISERPTHPTCPMACATE